MSSNVVHYHLPDDDQFSMDYIATDSEHLDERLDSYDDDTETEVLVYDLNQEFYVVYKNPGPSGTVDELEYDLQEPFREMDNTDRAIARQYTQVFQGINNQKLEEEGKPLDAYKSLEIEAVPKALERAKWTENVPTAGGSLIANLILRHALPNANHRTAFGLLELYLEAIDESFDMPSLATDNYDWQGWVDPFIVDSKRLTTVRRNTTRFRILSELGCKTVVRKGGIEISLSDFDLDIGYRQALTEYARRHEERSIDFVKTVLRRADHEELLDQSGIPKTQFAEWL